MSASLRLVHLGHHGGDEDELPPQPGFWNDDQAYASFLAEIEDDASSIATLHALGFHALLAMTTPGAEDAEVVWTTPEELARAAREMAKLIERSDPAVEPLLERYDLGANRIDDVRLELTRDLRDLAALAEWGALQGWARVALEVSW